MATSFSFDHTFRAGSPAAVFDAYFDRALVDAQDRTLDHVSREVSELVDDGTAIRRVSKVTPRRQLPAVLKPFVSSPLYYIETAIGRRPTTATGPWSIEIETRFASLRKVPTVRGRYTLTQSAAGTVARRFEGTVTADIALLSSRIERGIVAELERSTPITAACMQAFLDGSPAEPTSKARSSA